ncbi:MAG: DUF4912 domain-containing protein [Candidatus ainarchaeum sp.]|nr:DUF4912 domain-containing protein [Candidatus ainarchaeum sp.]
MAKKISDVSNVEKLTTKAKKTPAKSVKKVSKSDAVKDAEPKVTKKIMKTSSVNVVATPTPIEKTKKKTASTVTAKVKATKALAKEAKEKVVKSVKATAVKKTVAMKTDTSVSKATAAKAEVSATKTTKKVAATKVKKATTNKTKATETEAEVKVKKTLVKAAAAKKTTVKKATTATKKTTTTKKSSATKTTTTAKKRTSKKSVAMEVEAEVIVESPKSEVEINAKSATDVWESYHKPEKVGLPPPPEPPQVPDNYGDTRVVLLARDPEWMYCYWEISDEKRNELGLSDFITSNRLVLKIYRIEFRNNKPLTPQFAFEIPVPEYAKEWYVRVTKTGGVWCAELCVYNRNNNKYETITKSNIMETPRNDMSPDDTVLWMHVDDETFDQLLASGVDDGILENDDFEKYSKIDREGLINESRMYTIKLLHGSEESLLRVPMTSINALSSLDLVSINKGK